MQAFTQESDPLVSIVVLNWNGAHILPRCLNSIAAQTFQDFEVIVADNASTDGSADEIEKRWPGFKVIRFDQNLGFALGNNRAATRAKGRWLAFVNNDAFPDPEWLGCIMKAAQAYPDFSFFSSRLVYADQPDRVQSSGDIYNISGFAWSRDNHCPVEQSHLDPDEVFSPSAAAAVYLSDAFIEAGGFTRRFTSHHEDVDLGFRLRLLGNRCLYVPDAVVPHLGSASYGKESNRTVYQVQRNVVWAYFQNMPGVLFWKYLPAHLFANLVFLIYYTLRRQAGPVWKAKWDAFRTLRETLRERTRIQKTRRLESKEIDRILNHNWFAPFLLGRRTRAIRSHFNPASERRNKPR